MNFIVCQFRLCLGAWQDHGERTGGFYACNRYEAAKQEGVVCELNIFVCSFNQWITQCSWYLCLKFHSATLQYDEAERRREMAKNSLERYTHYYERWASNQLVYTCFPNLSLFLVLCNVSFVWLFVCFPISWLR